MRVCLLVLMAIALTSCAKPIAGWSVAGADVTVFYNREAQMETELSSVRKWPAEEFRARASRGQNVGGAAVTLHLNYDPPKTRPVPAPSLDR